MSVSDRMTQARAGREARRSARATRDALTRELASYSTPRERMEIELLASRSNGSDAALVLDILDQLTAEDTRDAALRRTA